MNSDDTVFTGTSTSFKMEPTYEGWRSADSKTMVVGKKYLINLSNSRFGDSTYVGLFERYGSRKKMKFRITKTRKGFEVRHMSLELNARYVYSEKVRILEMVPRGFERYQERTVQLILGSLVDDTFAFNNNYLKQNVLTSIEMDGFASLKFSTRNVVFNDWEETDSDINLG